MHKNYHEGACIRTTVAQEWNQKIAKEFTPTRKCNANFRSSVTHCLFKELLKDEQEKWAKAAKSEAALKKKKYEEDLKAPPSQHPIVRQQCLNNVGAFLGPILEGM